MRTSTVSRIRTLSLAAVAATAVTASLAMPASAASSDVGVAAAPKKKLLFTNKHYDADFWLGPCKAVAWHRNITSIPGGERWSYMTTYTQLYKGPKKDCTVKVQLRARARSDKKIHNFSAKKKGGTATVQLTGKRCWSLHTIYYKGYSYTVKLTADAGFKC
ncbi:hypothetical protein [Actinomadura rudentiformis]|uniref:Secreted protein n=1 Tax=Actinomadura rudentiformis TaxID=359158 RepID=A0A6H9YPU7_9ACTN|nr:hypothetical protein [Actinomadura rudentiformis]KAB2344861.1 hypothetical protein F8566_30175 [Actinomadura rudentiformis]